MTMLQPVDDFIFEGWNKRFQQVFGCKMCAFIQDNDETKVLNRLFDGKDIEYPYAWFKIDTTSNTPETFSTNYMARRGFDIAVRDDKLLRAKFVPTTFDITVTYITNQFDGVYPGSVRSFLRRWPMARRSGFMKFKVNYGRVQFGINVELGDSVQVPAGENKTEQEAVYKITTNASIRGYVSEPEIQEIGKINHLDVVSQITGVNANVAGSQFFPFPEKS